MVGKAIQEFQLIKAHDHLLIGFSGGKDSWLLFETLFYLKAKAPIPFQISIAHIKQNNQSNNLTEIKGYFESLNVPFLMNSYDIESIIQTIDKKIKTPCSLCSRLRRGHLTGIAQQIKANKIALGHHKDDFIETLLMNQFFTGKLTSMPPQYTIKKEQIEVIRPLIYVEEDLLFKLANEFQIPLLVENCPLTRDNTKKSQRKQMKELISNLEKTAPHIRSSLLKAITRNQS